MKEGAQKGELATILEPPGASGMIKVRVLATGEQVTCLKAEVDLADSTAIGKWKAEQMDRSFQQGVRRMGEEEDKRRESKQEETKGGGSEQSHSQPVEARRGSLNKQYEKPPSSKEWGKRRASFGWFKRTSL